MTEDYQRFLQTKRFRAPDCGFTVSPDAINPMLFPFQRDLVLWALRKGRAGIFADPGLGKTLMQLEFARILGRRALIAAPLSVARQTVREGRKLGVDIHYTRTGADLSEGINITNYEMLERFDANAFQTIVLDESSILKALAGHTRRLLTTMFARTPYRLCCTATPAPNDHVELGNHAEFLGICTEAEMRAIFFINANKEHTFEYENIVYHKKGMNKHGTEWRLKHNAEQPFFQWLASWAISLGKPSDLGYDDDGFILPELRILTHFVNVDRRPEGQLFFTHLHGITDRVSVRRETLPARLQVLQDLVADDKDQWILWVGLDQEQRAVEKLLGHGYASVYGSLDPDEKERRLEQWLDGEIQFLISKPRVAGFGLNLQQAHKMAFVGIGDSWEQLFQCVRREWRFMQEHPVQVHVILSDQEAEIWANLQRKDAMARRLRQGLIESVRSYEQDELARSEKGVNAARQETITGKGWIAMLGDSCERLKEIEDSSIDLACFSPPFGDLYVYTDTPRDLGNSRGWDEFFAHYSFIIKETLRVTRPGRLNCVHTSDIPAMQERDGYIGIRDFPGEVIRAYMKEGWIFVGRALVPKNPQVQAVRVKSKALLFVQLRKDSADSRPALIDHILLFKKPGENIAPVTPVANGELDNETWIEWANGVWLGIRETDTLQVAEGRDVDDDKHICPLQLGTIERCIKLYSNPGELVLSPFMGIGSEGYQAVKFKRRFVGIELKDSYFRASVKNLQRAEAQANMPDLFSYAEKNGIGISAD